MSYQKDKRYQDYQPETFIYKAKRTVYKWWCVVYCPVYKLTHNGYWPAEKSPENKYPSQVQKPSFTNNEAAHMAEELLHEQQDNIDSIITSIEAATTPSSNTSSLNSSSDSSHNNSPISQSATNEEEAEFDTSNVDSNVLDKANEIMARLAREAAEDEAKKQAEIESAKEKARENERLAMIMQANKVDISSFIEEGRAHQEDSN